MENTSFRDAVEYSITLLNCVALSHAFKTKAKTALKTVSPIDLTVSRKRKNWGNNG